MTNLVIIDREALFVSSFDLAKGFGVEHRNIKILLQKYESEFGELAKLEGEFRHLECRNSDTGNVGRPKQEYFLNEPQATYLTTLLQNNDQVRRFKMYLTQQFFAQRKFLNKLVAQRQNEEYYKKRAEGKIERRLETDRIKEFVEYATNQGSKNAKMYYMNITKMENSSLFCLDFMGQRFPNLREVLDGLALDIIKMADIIVGKALEDGMNQGLNYKDVYILARDNVEKFAVCMGKTPLRLIMDKAVADRSRAVISTRAQQVLK